MHIQILLVNFSMPLIAGLDRLQKDYFSSGAPHRCSQNLSPSLTNDESNVRTSTNIVRAKCLKIGNDFPYFCSSLHVISPERRALFKDSQLLWTLAISLGFQNQYFMVSLLWRTSSTTQSAGDHGRKSQLAKSWRTNRWAPGHRVISHCSWSWPCPLGFAAFLKLELKYN